MLNKIELVPGQAKIRDKSLILLRHDLGQVSCILSERLFLW